MKKLVLTLCLQVVFLLAIAQTSDKGFSFQGYAIDPDGKSLASTAITVRFTLSPGTFTEDHSVTTDAFGVFHAIVGNSSAAKNAEFKKLDFTKKGDNYSLKVEVKKTSGGVFTTISDAPLLAVPYARAAANGVPVGTIVAYGGDKNNVPEGWLLCDGTSYLQTDYPQLYAIVGDAWGTSGSSFNVPDLRGRFLRGVDGGAAVDPDAASRTAIKTGGNTGDKVGTAQADGYASHNHGVTDPGHNHTNGSWNSLVKVDGTNTPDGFDGTGAGEPNLQTVGAIQSNTTGISINNSGGNETRPENAGVYYIIKY